MHNIRIHYKDPKRSNYERLISRTVLALTLTAGYMIFYLWQNYPQRVPDSFLIGSLLFLLVQHPIFRLMHLRERKRVISVSGSHLSYYEGKKKVEMELDSTLRISAKSILGFLPYVTLANKGKSCTIPVVMDGIEQLPEHILEHREDKRALKSFILYYKSVGKYIDKIARIARKSFPYLAIIGFTASKIVWEHPLEVALFWMLITFVMPMFAVTTSYLLLKIVVSVSRSKRKRNLAVIISLYLTLTVYLTYGILFRGMILS